VLLRRLLLRRKIQHSELPATVHDEKNGVTMSHDLAGHEINTRSGDGLSKHAHHSRHSRTVQIHSSAPIFTLQMVGCTELLDFAQLPQIKLRQSFSSQRHSC